MRANLRFESWLVICFVWMLSGCGENAAKQPVETVPQEETPQVEFKDSATPKAASKETISFPSEDQLEITADLYVAHDPAAPFIVLFHQARWSRGEYLEIAPKLNKLGFNCMAVDQRSGGEVNGVANETHKRAVAGSKAVSYLDGYPDLVAALKFAKMHHAKGRLVVWGSSYSSALIFRLAAEHPSLVDALLSFAPGEYFEKETGNDMLVTSAAAKVKCPVFVTSAKNEAPAWASIFDAVTSTKESYLPETDGKHGSSALWEERSDSPGYWKAVEEFLKKNID